MIRRGTSKGHWVRRGIAAWLLAAAVSAGLCASAHASAPGTPESRPLPALPSKGQAKGATAKTNADDSVPLRGGSESHLGGSVFQTVAALATVIGVILILGVVVKKVAKRGGGFMGALGPGGRAPSGLLEVLGRYPVSRGTTLVLLKMDRRILLLCQSGGGKLGGGAGMTTLCEVNDPEEVASILLKTRDEEGESLAKRFQSLLSGEESVASELLDTPSRQAHTSVTGPDSFQLTQARAQSKPVSAIRTRLDSRRGGAPAQPAAAGGKSR